MIAAHQEQVARSEKMKTRSEVIREYDARQSAHDSYKAAYPDSNQSDFPLNVTAEEAHMVELLREADAELAARS